VSELNLELYLPQALEDAGAMEKSTTSVSPYTDITEEEAVRLVVDSYRAAAEREITIGDGLHIWLVTTEEDEDVAATGQDSELQGQDQWQRPRKTSLQKIFFSLPKH
jgi:hypothetical protein